MFGQAGSIFSIAEKSVDILYHLSTFIMAPTSCGRCSEPAALHLPARPLCRTCFHAQMTLAYKRSLGRALYEPRSTSPVAILVSGGPASASLAVMHVTHLANLRRNPSKPIHDIHLVHVAVSAAATASVRELSNRLSLSLTVCDAPERPDLGDAAEAERVYAGMVRGAAVEAAKGLGADVTLAGTTTDRAAVDVLWRVVLGCGESVGSAASVEMFLEDGRMIRPLLHMEVRAVNFYWRFFGFDFPLCGGVGWDGKASAGGGHSLLGTLEMFVESVQHENNSVVHNVVRTAARLENSCDGGQVCRCCGDSYPQEGNDFRVAKHVSSAEGSTSCCNGNDECAFQRNYVAQSLCYGCDVSRQKKQ